MKQISSADGEQAGSGWMPQRPFRVEPKKRLNAVPIELLKFGKLVRVRFLTFPGEEC